MNLKELTKLIEEAKKKNEELKKIYEPIEVLEGFWFKYHDRVFVFLGLEENNKPVFKELVKKEGEKHMAIDANGNWVGHTVTMELSDLEVDYFKVAKDLLMNIKISFKDFESIKTFIERIDTENMTLFEATIFNVLTGKTFVKNSWSEDAKSRLQMFIYDNKLITQDEEQVSTKSGSVKLDSPDRFSLYKGSYKSLIDNNNEKVIRLKELKEEIEPFYNKIKEYERLKQELNL